MRRFLLASILGIVAANAANSATETLDRDARRFAACVAALDADCVFDSTHVESQIAAGVRTPYVDREWLGELWDDPQQAAGESGWNGVARFESLQAREPFRVDGRLFAFVPYFQVNQLYGERLERTGLLIGVSEDDGGSWRFVIINGLHIQAHQVPRIFPELSGIELPPIRNRVLPRPEPVRTKYLGTTYAGFSPSGRAVLFALRFDIRRKIRSDVDLIVQFDDPSHPDQPAILEGNLSEGQERLEIRSPLFTGFEPGTYYDVMVRGIDSGSGEDLFEHRQRLLFDPSSELWQ